MKISEVDMNKVSPMMVHYIEIKKKYNDAIVFYRLGDFYEMFFEDAITASHELELTLTGRNAGLDERVPMCGIPYHAYQAYLEKLVDKGYKVAICEQLEDPKDAKGIVDRDVIQVVTKGTIMDNLLSEKDNNYLASIYNVNGDYLLTYTDITTGEINSLILNDSDSLIREIVNKGIKEVIASSNIDRETLYIIKDNYHLSLTITDDLLEDDSYKYIYSDIKDIRIITGIKHLLNYVIQNKKSSLTHFEKVHYLQENDYLLFDIHTSRNLELIRTIRDDNRMYSLLWLLDKTKTAMGSRLLKHNIESPIKDQKELERRFDIIDTFKKEFINRVELEKLLDSVYDLERLSGRISYGNVNARDMLQLLRSLSVLPDIKAILNNIHYDKDIDSLDQLRELLENSLCDNPPVTIHEGGLIKDGYNKELDELKSICKNSKDYILEIEENERNRTGIKNLKIGYNKVFGYYIEVSKSNIPLIKDEYGYIRKQTLVNGERYITEDLKEKESIILGSSEKIVNLEYDLFMEIREVAKTYIPKLQQISKVLSEVDMLISFTNVAENNNYVRPSFNNKHEIKIIDGRHPVVEMVNKSEYVPNDIVMNKNTDILLITGPNMAGKSTYMRQLAIIVIMAQIGSFVPCKECDIPIFDKIFTRIGASDDLVSGESTFMVEMKEAEVALSKATEDSLILFDELGRGTATYDGMSLAEAILEYIHDHIHAKTLFSTHYHELTNMANALSKIKNVHVSAEENDGNITFLHKVLDGSIDKSYGINVASLAGLPDEVITRAKEILSIYEKKGYNKRNVQTSFVFEEKTKSSKIEDEIAKIDVLNLTPIEALNKLYELKEKMKEK